MFYVLRNIINVVILRLSIMREEMFWVISFLIEMHWFPNGINLRAGYLLLAHFSEESPWMNRLHKSILPVPSWPLKGECDWDYTQIQSGLDHGLLRSRAPETLHGQCLACSFLQVATPHLMFPVVCDGMNKIHGAAFSKEGLHPYATLKMKPEVTLKEGLMMRLWKPL